jgi:hypothetical protein
VCAAPPAGSEAEANRCLFHESGEILSAGTATNGDCDSPSPSAALALYPWAITISRFDTSSEEEISDRRRQTLACRRKYSELGMMDPPTPIRQRSTLCLVPDTRSIPSKHCGPPGGAYIGSGVLGAPLSQGSDGVTLSTAPCSITSHFKPRQIKSGHCGANPASAERSS